MNIFLHELKAHRNATLIWSLSLSMLIAFFMSMYPAIAKEAEDFKELLAGYPPEFLAAFGIALDSITSLLGYYSYVFLYIVLCTAIQGMHLGISILSKEAREQTADFLLTKPIARTTIVTAKLFAAITLIVLTNAIYMGAAALTLMVVGEESFSTTTFLLITSSSLWVAFMFFAFGICLSVVLRRVKAVVSFSLGIVFSFFVLSMLASAMGKDALSYFTPFLYYDTAYILKHKAYELKFVIIQLGFIITTITATYLIYIKKDIDSV
ncbi:ABC transporter permease [Mechercharimyces sp. CAU 1602]|uniref:ABC transporter permease n=1 Tax=Mechercharimyces sp. CAU 1602 TaxID=2973933 RepID=UPI0021621614|nr:ABC transporter permease [Mechercharimyces sp. CAU 1602]MCS1351056.1 ABC transporter permease [Mechercharimyces sp. CAU 1602]